MTITIIIPENTMMKQIKEWLEYADVDEISRVSGEIFGGKCYSNGEAYCFTPDENYAGVFDGNKDCLESISGRGVYFISELERDSDGGYIPCIAIEGELGYHKTDWNWGSNIKLAEQIANEKNLALGFTEKEAFSIMLGTMRKK